MHFVLWYKGEAKVFVKVFRLFGECSECCAKARAVVASHRIGAMVAARVGTKKSLHMSSWRGLKRTRRRQSVRLYALLLAQPLLALQSLQRGRS